VLDAGSCVAAMARIRADPSLLQPGAGTHGLYAEARWNGEAARVWCEQRGLSFTMTCHGAARPSAAEVATGYVDSAGPPQRT